MPCSFGATTSVECIVTKTFHMADTDAHTRYLIHNKYPSETDTVPHSVFQKRKLTYNTNMYINLKVTRMSSNSKTNHMHIDTITFSLVAKCNVRL